MRQIAMTKNNVVCVKRPVENAMEHAGVVRSLRSLRSLRNLRILMGTTLARTKANGAQKLPRNVPRLAENAMMGTTLARTKANGAQNGPRNVPRLAENANNDPKNVL